MIGSVINGFFETGKHFIHFGFRDDQRRTTGYDVTRKSPQDQAVLLGLGRGFGETMAVLMATGHAVNIPGSLFDSVRALTATIAAELGETAVDSEHYQALFAIGIFLFIITFLINLCADLIVRGVREG